MSKVKASYIRSVTQPKNTTITATVITPPTFARSHLPQVVEMVTPSWGSFWLRAFIANWHLSVLALFAPLDRSNR